MALKKGLQEGTIDGLPNYAVSSSTTYTTSTAIAKGDLVVELNKGSAQAMTMEKPEPGRVLVIHQKNSNTDDHTVTLSQGTFDGTNNKLTLNAAAELVVLYGVSHTEFTILLNVGSVGTSSV